MTWVFSENSINQREYPYIGKSGIPSIIIYCNINHVGIFGNDK